MKVFKNPIFMFILGLIVMAGISAVANGLLASQIDYDNSTSHLKDANNQDITTVQGALDALYNSSNIIQTKLSIIDTNECISGTFVCDSDCTGSSGKEILNFIPSIFYMHNQSKVNIIYYNSSLSSSIWDLGQKSNWIEYPAPNYSNYFSFTDNKTYVKNWYQNSNVTIDYVACK